MNEEKEHFSPTRNLLRNWIDFNCSFPSWYPYSHNEIILKCFTQQAVFSFKVRLKLYYRFLGRGDSFSVLYNRDLKKSKQRTTFFYAALFLIFIVFNIHSYNHLLFLYAGY
jgi:hypothetical protein